MIDRARGDGSDFEYEHRLQMPDHSVKYLHMIAHGTRPRMVNWSTSARFRT